jgi:uroporphyrinogen decarboxylase
MDSVSKKELIFKAFNNEETYRTPVGFWFHFLDEASFGEGLIKPEIINLNIAGHRRFIERFRPDMVKIMSDGFFLPPVRDINDVDDILAIAPLAANHIWTEKQVELVKTVTAMDTDIPYFYNIFSPLTTLRFMLGADKLLSLILEDAERVSKAAYNIGLTLAGLAERVIREGSADGIYLSVQNPNIEQISDLEYEKFFTPADMLILNAANAASENNILHICGYEGVRNRLAAWRNYPAKAYNWAVNVEGVTLSEGKALFSGKAVIGGFANPKGSLIDTGTREEIEAFVTELLQKTGKRGVVIGADCTVNSETTPERYEWVRQAAARM